MSKVKKPKNPAIPTDEAHDVFNLRHEVKARGRGNGLAEEQVREAIKIAIHMAGSQKAFAHQADISPQYLNEIVQGRKDISDKLLKWFGLERVVRYHNTNT